MKAEEKGRKNQGWTSWNAVNGANGGGLGGNYKGRQAGSGISLFTELIEVREVVGRRYSRSESQGGENGQGTDELEAAWT